MTIAINVKWYVNWDDWGVADVWPSLLTYEEILQYSDANELVEELNKNPILQYNLLKEWWHMQNFCWFEYEDIANSSNDNFFYISGNVICYCFETRSSEYGKRSVWRPCPL